VLNVYPGLDGDACKSSTTRAPSSHALSFDLFAFFYLFNLQSELQQAHHEATAEYIEHLHPSLLCATMVNIKIKSLSRHGECVLLYCMLLRSSTTGYINNVVNYPSPLQHYLGAMFFDEIHPCGRR
jgi:hypothetical protein